MMEKGSEEARTELGQVKQGERYRATKILSERRGDWGDEIRSKDYHSDDLCRSSE